MSDSSGQTRVPSGAADTDLRALQEECARLAAVNRSLIAYIRAKTNGLLEVLGTRPLADEELAAGDLVEFDPIGIVTTSFMHVLANLRRTCGELEFAHAELQALFDTVGSALLVVDPQRRIRALNQKARQLLIGHADDVLGKNCRDVVCQGRTPASHCLCERVLASRRAASFDDWQLGEHFFSVVGQPLFDDTGAVSHVVLAYADVTERRRNEEELRRALDETRESKTKIDGILRSVADGLLIYDAEGRLILANRLAEKLLGFDLTESLGDRFEEKLSCRELVAHLTRVRESGEAAATHDLELTCPDGRACVFQARTSVMRDDAGSLRGTITFLHEVTREREVDRMKSEFVSTAAHELRTPLASILGFSELLLSDPELSEETRSESLAIIHEKSERLAEIVSDLLDISRIESGEALEMSLQPVRLASLCEQALLNFSGVLPAHRIELDLPEEEIPLFIDCTAMLRVFENLLSNALKYSPGGGLIRVSAEIDDRCCRIRFSDEGIGMSPNQMERAFEKFYRGDASDTAVAGTGLGLTIVKHVVEAHGGEVALASSLGCGTTVQVSLPLPSAD